MKLVAPLLLFVTLAAAVACGDDGNDSPKFVGESSGGRRSSGGRSGSGGSSSGGSENSGGTAGSGGTGSGGEDVDGGGGTPGSGGASSGGASSGGSGGVPETGGTQGSGGMVVKPVCHLSTTNEICDECIHDGCSFECVDCENNDDCVATLGCMLDCGATAKCFNDCKAMYPDGAAAFDNVTLNCGRARCSSFCPFFH